MVSAVSRPVINNQQVRYMQVKTVTHVCYGGTGFEGETDKEADEGG